MMEEIEFDTVSKTKNCIAVRGAYKRYGLKTIILNGLNLTVPCGGIYGLLGPSGCGKTTLLNCIVGQLQLDSGSIWLNVKKRSEIGYMPQAISLHESMTIFENFFFYGYLFNMDSRNIQSRAIDLITLLDLPSGHRIVGDLSGGQRRRISMAVTIIHDPKLMILDEPTAGLDPILSHSLWLNLKQMANAGKSIILTTHYIQEVEAANRVGIMRNGILLIEDNPQNIMSNCQCSSIEEAFLMLSHKQEDEEKKIEYIERLQPTKVKYDEDVKFFSMKKFRAIMYKNIKQTRRELSFHLLIVLLPVFAAVFFNTAIGRYPKHLHLAVVNEESNCEVYPQNSCFLDQGSTVPLSCMFIEALRSRTYKTIIYPDNEKALNNFNNPRVWGIVHFKRNYTRAIVSRMDSPRNMSDEEFLDGFVDLRVDSSNFIISEITLKLDLISSLWDVLEEAFEVCRLNPKAIRLPPIELIKMREGNTDNFISSVSSTLLILTSFTSASLAASLQMFAEKSTGILERMKVTGVTLKEIVLVVMILQFITIMIQNTLVFFVMFYMFSNIMRGSWTSLLSLGALTGISGVSFGIILALINDSFSFMAFMGINVNLWLCFTTGLFWPVEAAHKCLKMINWLIPLSSTVAAALGITSKNLSIDNPTVLTGFIECFAWNAIFLLLIYCIVNRQKLS